MQSHTNTLGDKERHLSLSQVQDHMQQITNNQTAEYGAGVFDTVTLTAIFSMFLTTSTTVFLQETGRLFLFPFAALANILRASIAWRQAYLEKFKQMDTIVKATVETLVTIAITFAVVASLAATAIFGGFISPVIFAVTLGLKSLYQVAAAGFYWGKAMLTATDNILKNQYRTAARDNFVAAVSTLLATTAIILVFVFAKPLMAPFGIAAGIVGVGLTAHGVYRGLRNKDGDFSSDVESGDEQDEQEVKARHENGTANRERRTHALENKRQRQHDGTSVTRRPVSTSNSSSYHSILHSMGRDSDSGSPHSENEEDEQTNSHTSLQSDVVLERANSSPVSGKSSTKNSPSAGLARLPLQSASSTGDQKEGGVIMHLGRCN
jgi:hypothetical protein